MTNKASTNQQKTNKGKDYTFLLFIGALVSLFLLAGAAGNLNRAFAAKPTRLTLTAAGCTYLQQAGIQNEIKNSICSVTVQFAQNKLSSGGNIRIGEDQIEISEGQVVGAVPIEDGADVHQPWTKKQTEAAAWAGVLVAFQIAILIFLFRLTKSSNKHDEVQK